MNYLRLLLYVGTLVLIVGVLLVNRFFSGHSRSFVDQGMGMGLKKSWKALRQVLWLRTQGFTP